MDFGHIKVVLGICLVRDFFPLELSCHLSLLSCLLPHTHTYRDFVHTPLPRLRWASLLLFISLFPCWIELKWNSPPEQLTLLHFLFCRGLQIIIVTAVKIKIVKKKIKKKKNKERKEKEKESRRCQIQNSCKIGGCQRTQGQTDGHTHPWADDERLPKVNTEHPLPLQHRGQLPPAPRPRRRSPGAPRELSLTPQKSGERNKNTNK